MAKEIDTGLDFITQMKPSQVDEKGWGQELYLHNCEHYCGKFLIFNKDKECSLHMHKEKNEMFMVLKGAFLIKTSFKPSEKMDKEIYYPGNMIIIHSGLYHQMKGLDQPSVLLEISSEHKDEDSYRLVKGD